MSLSICRAIDLLEKAWSAGSALVTVRAGDVVNLITWARIQAAETELTTNLLDWLYDEARKYETSIDDGSAAEPRTDPEYYEWLNEQGRQIRAKIEEGY